MTKRLFLSGTIGVGKSTLIRHCLLPYLPFIDGFYVQRILKDGHLTAFRFKPVSASTDYQLTLTVNNLEGLDNLFLYANQHGDWQRNDQVFLESGVNCLRQSLKRNNKLILFDELGGVELHIPAFMAEVYRILKNQIPILGVIKAPANAQILERAETGKGVIDVNLSFIEYINNLQNTELIYLDLENRAATAITVRNFVEEICNEQK
jgi:nucleoside-triphosphatase